jgi:phthalate 4,5-cis-dihydrodiol dehydrogenase
MPNNGAPVVRVGLIGLGGAGSSMTSRFARDPRYRVAGAADVDTELLERFQQDFPDAAALSSAEALCQRTDIDLIYIGTPNRFHSEHARLAAENRKHVLIEKPMTITLDDADEMIATADRNGVLLGVNVKHSFEPRIQKLSEFARTGEYGQFRMLHHWRYADWLYRPRTPEELTPEWGGGLVWRQGPHQFDIFRTIGGGLVRNIHGNVGVWDPARRVAGAYTAYLEFQSGAVGTAVYSGYDHYESGEMVVGPIDAPDAEFAEARREFRSHGESVEWETSAARAERYGGNRQHSAGGVATRRVRARVPSSGGGWILHGPLIASFDHADVKLSAGGLLVFGDRGRQEIPMQEAADGIAGRLDTFYTAIVHDKPLPADGCWGKATLEVLLALEESSRIRADVSLNHQVPVVVQ